MSATETAITDLSAVDMVTLSIIDRTLVSITREMGILMMKTSYSTLFNEGLDFTCALADTSGDMIAVADFVPSQVGGMPLVIKTMIRELRATRPLEEGDVILHNDPFRGGLHTPEHTFLKGIFHEGELIAYAAVIGHVSEVGGMVPGGFSGEAEDVFQEGLRVPPVRVKKKGELVEDIWRMLLANVRTPRFNYGDYLAMIASIDLGESRILDTIRKYGPEEFRKAVSSLLDYSEQRMRAEISELPDGYYAFEDTMDDDGLTEGKKTFKAEVFVQGDEIVVDWSGSSTQTLGPINATLGVAWSAVYNAVLHLTDPSIPRNSGCFRPIKVLAPPGSIVNVDYPGSSVGGNSESSIRMAYSVIGALAPARPDKIAASDGGTNTSWAFGGVDPRTGDYYSILEITGVGWGGRAFADGNDALCPINGNCRFTPTEVFETRYPWLIEELALAENSGGAGKYRGGLSVRKILRCLAGAEITISQVSDRYENPAWGVFGGKPGALGSCTVKLNGETGWTTVQERYNKLSKSKFSHVTLKGGDRVRWLTPGAGGYGDPMEREPAAIVEDLLEGFVTAEFARDHHGYGEVK